MSKLQKYIPSPFAIAVVLTVVTMALALIFTPNTSDNNHLIAVLKSWEKGIWNNSMLVFGYQMMLILVLGHILVLSKPMTQLTNRLTSFVNSTVTAVVLVSVSTMLVSFFNWGLGLIFGAIMARKVGEAAQQRGFNINYPLVGASGYIGFMVWHAGISGSAPLKVAESGHLASLMEGIQSNQMISNLPDLVPTGETIFSWWNLTLFAILLLIVPLVLTYMAKRTKATAIPVFNSDEKDDADASGKVDTSSLATIIFGVLLLSAFFVSYFDQLRQLILTPNMLNFFMFGLGILLHGTFKNYLKALQQAIGGASGILIQFPLYFGIMGIMKDTGMVTMISNLFVSISNETTLPLFAFFSAGLVNVFVPSGGGQWAVQGPIVIESALQLGVPLNKMIMALAYGDQITNMLQPFWALPLLAITKLKAREILPYTVVMMFVGSAVYLLGLWLL